MNWGDKRPALSAARPPAALGPAEELAQARRALGQARVRALPRAARRGARALGCGYGGALVVAVPAAPSYQK